MQSRCGAVGRSGALRRVNPRDRRCRKQVPIGLRPGANRHFNHRSDLIPTGRIEPGKRFVEDKDVGVVQDCLGESETLHGPAAQVHDAPLPMLGDAGSGEGPVNGAGQSSTIQS